jgi:uncharacterized protein involved in tolerance to divalent cations
MNLICFPHYTCGGLMCDLLSNTFSPVGRNGGIQSFLHSIGKIGDSDVVFDQFDAGTFVDNLKKINGDQHQWVGTHCWPGNINLDFLDQVIVITTATYRSKIYRWVRAYHHYFLPSKPWLEVQKQQRIDKERETAKNYLVPFRPVDSAKIINLEFAEVVENRKEFSSLIHNLNPAADINLHMDRWQALNKFLYDKDIWSSDPCQRFYEAELETQHNKFYVYE